MKEEDEERRQIKSARVRDRERERERQRERERERGQRMTGRQDEVGFCDSSSAGLEGGLSPVLAGIRHPPVVLMGAEGIEDTGGG